MAQKRKGMEVQKEITRLKELGHSNRKIAKILGINKDTVAKYVNGAAEKIECKKPDWVKGLDWEQVEKEIALKVPKNILLKSYQKIINCLASSHPESMFLQKRSSTV